MFFTDVAELDITDYTAIEKFIQVHEVDTIINCAAYTAVDRAEDEPGPAAEINTQAVANLAKAAQKGDCLLIHISTDYVFAINYKLNVHFPVPAATTETHTPATTETFTTIKSPPIIMLRSMRVGFSSMIRRWGSIGKFLKQK